MKKLVTSLFGLLIMLSSLQAATKSIDNSAASQPKVVRFANQEVKSDRDVIFTDGFETYTDFAKEFTPWVTVDVDASTTYGINGVTFSGSQEAHAYIVFNPALTTPALTTPAWLPHGGAKYLASFAATVPTNNDWAISPPIQLQSMSQVKFWAKSVTAQYGLEKFKVAVSTGSTTPADFTVISGATTIEAPVDWTEFTYDLSAYDGQSVRIGIQCLSSDAFAFQLDDFSVLGGPSGPDVAAPTVVSLAGNSVLPGAPMNLTLIVADQSNVPATITAVYNIGAGDQTITMTKSTKTQYTYTGTIPASATEVTGTVKFNLADLVVPPNTATTPNYEIKWAVPPLPGVFGQGESFEGTFVPDGWANIDVDGATPAWAQFPAATITAHTGTKAAWHKYNGTADQDGLLITPYMKVNATAPKLTFWQYDQFPNDYSYHGVMVSTTTTDPASFTELAAVPVGTAAWSVKEIDLSAYAGQKVYLAFKYTGNNADSWYIDDVKIDALPEMPIDITAPIAAAPTGTIANIGNVMTIQTVVTDATGIASVVGHYQINGGAWSDFTMTASKVTGTYTGTIPAQAAAVTGKVKFTCSDTVTPVNTDDSPMFDISWLDPSLGMWAGNVDALNTSGLGLQDAAPWKLGVALDFGTANKKITKIAYMCNSGSDGAFNWSVLDMTDATTWSADVLTPGGVLVSTPVIGTEWNVVDVNDTTSLTGTVGLAIDLVAGGFFGRHAEGTNGKSYIYYENAWLKLGEGVVASFPGDWTLKCWVEPWSNGIGEESEMLPGKSELSQNYPNPFNPSTSINFYNNMTGNVKLTVLNAKGETVATLINNNVVAGNHKVNFDGARFNSGVYFYKLETPTATITKKMLLVK